VRDKYEDRWTEEERREMAGLAVEMRAKRMTMKEIGAELGCSPTAVKKLVDEEYARRRPRRERARAKALADYDALIRECWRRLAAFHDSSAAQNVSGIIGQIRQILERIDKITGAEAPTKTQHERKLIKVEELPEESIAKLHGLLQEDPDLWDMLLEEDG
jgi:predicted transcriptional regulator